MQTTNRTSHVGAKATSLAKVIRLQNFGHSLERVGSFEEALNTAGLNWDVTTGPCQTMVGGQLIDVPDFKTVVRADNLKPLGVVGAKYQPFQNREALSIVEDLMKVGGATMERGGTFAEGAATFFCLRLPGVMKIGVKGDEVAKYLTLVNSHDGSQMFRALFSPFRIACSNQIRALLSKFKESISIRHTKNGINKLDEARRSLSAAQGYYERFESLADRLARISFDDKQMIQLAETIFPTKKNEEGEEEEVSGRTESNRTRLIDLATLGAGHRETGIAGTAWGAINAVAEFVDFERGTRTFGGADESFSRSQAAWFGAGAKVKADAFATVQRMVGLAA